MLTASATALLLLLAAPASPVERAEEAFEAGRYEDAADAFGEAFAADPDPKFVYAQAQAERLGGDCARAIELYDRFLALDPEPGPAEDARTNRERCRQDLERTSPPPAPDPPPPRPKVVTLVHDDAPPAPRPWHRDPLGGALVGSGLFVAALGTGLLVGGVTIDRSAADAAVEGDFERDRDRGLAMHRAGIALTAIGAAIVVGGVVRWIVVARRSRDARASARRDQYAQ
jgi:tetratricopeptide (TPR) repeat protein